MSQGVTKKNSFEGGVCGVGCEESTMINDVNCYRIYLIAIFTYIIFQIVQG